MTSSVDRRRHMESILGIAPPDPEAYARARLGSLLQRDPWVRMELDRRIADGMEPLASVEDVANNLPGRLFQLALDATGPTGRILDFGCGSGSFVNFGCDYESVPNPIVAIDKQGSVTRRSPLARRAPMGTARADGVEVTLSCPDEGASIGYRFDDEGAGSSTRQRSRCRTMPI